MRRAAGRAGRAALACAALWGPLGALTGCDDGAAPAADAAPDAEAPLAWRTAVGGPPADLGVMMSVWGPRPDAVFTVGGQPEAGVAWRFDGATWQALAVPEGPLLNWVHGADGVLWLVGDGGRALRSRDEGATFEVVPTGTAAPLWGVWAGPGGAVWAVGGDARAAQDAWAPVLLRLRGEAFEAVPLPAVDRGFSALFKVWGSGPDDVVAVGARGVLLRFDGAAWRQETVVGGLADDLISVWGSGPERVVVAGGRGNGVALVRRADGWARVAEDAIAVRPGLNGVWVDADGTASLVGVRGAALRLLPDDAVVRDRTETALVLHAVFGVGGRRFAVGGSLDSTPPWTGVVLEQGP